MARLAVAVANDILDHLLRTAAWTQPPAIYVSLHTADPGVTGANEHGATGAYARVAHASWDVAASGSAANNGTVTFPTATAAWTEVTHFGIWDASSAGNFLIGGVLDTPRTAAEDDVLRFADGALVVTQT
jgi:hypothetical protein